MPSSVIAAYHYNSQRKRLEVVFLSGSVYHYLDVPEWEYLAMKKAKSKGTYLNTHIKGRYGFEKVK